MISNATPLIFLSKIDQLDLLRKLFRKVIIPEAVKEEILIEDKPGAEKIQKGLNSGWIMVINPKALLPLNLGKCETAAISLAKERKDTLCLDDARAIKAAKVYNIPIIRTTTIIVIAVQKKVITFTQAQQLLNNLIQADYYIKPAEYALLFSKLTH